LTDLVALARMVRRFGLVAVTMKFDVVVVGGGIAGSALATVLAREGLETLVLERQEQFQDRVRGEYLVPWGVQEAERLELDEVLLGAGGHRSEAFVFHDLPAGADHATTEAVDYAEVVDGLGMPMAFGHPAACEALTQEAGKRGASVLRGVTSVTVVPGARPRVSYEHAGGAQQLECRLVVGADGRSSRVRRQAGIALERAAQVHMVAGLLVEDLDVDPTLDVFGIGDDVFMITFVQGGGRARLYLCWGSDDPQRFAGPDGTTTFVTASAVASVPHRGSWLEATPAGPVRTYPGDDTWTEHPFTDGVVLLGDAGGHCNPLIGQGLALALRDVRALSERLLDSDRWDGPMLASYGLERAERLRRMRFVAHLEATANLTFGQPGRALRDAIDQRQQQDPLFLAPVLAQYIGPDALLPEACTPDFARAYLGSPI
jgi:menaquinone-9 beta-reductase